ncbi:uncharacterized protein LOC122063486 [Macadamia integrifolia]|uniref:uncharacterized protein LOC122063486 n=1 Tax=Macadamia integrifolia TaxID=60698 RepID=UPI001C4F7A20|nr:uncharacterized protein LOC122063486 [Macadamia integrifolia]
MGGSFLELDRDYGAFLEEETVCTRLNPNGPVGRVRHVDPFAIWWHASATNPSQTRPSTNASRSLRVANVSFHGFLTWTYPNVANPGLPHLLEPNTDIDASLGLPIPYDYCPRRSMLRLGGCTMAYAR